jgi:PAS domain S-box-containing protein
MTIPTEPTDNTSRPSRHADSPLEQAQSAAVLRVTFQSIGDAVITTDAQCRITAMNPVAEQLTGWSQVEARGLPLDGVFRIVNELSRQSVESPASRALSQGVIVGLANHTLLIARDGSEKAIDDSAAPIRDETGAVIGCVLIFRDITARRREETRLRESESQLRMLTDHAPVLIARCDKNLTFRYVNRRYAERFGLPQSRIEGHPIEEILGSSAFETIRPHIEAVLGGQQAQFDSLIDYERIGRRYMRCVYEPERDDAGQVQGWIALVSDITEHQSAEEAKALLGTIVQSSQDAIVSKTLEGQILSWNKGAEQLFGYSATDAIGQSITLVIPPDRRHEESQILSRLGRGERIEHYETVRLTRSGRRIDVSLSISPIRDSAGKIVGAAKIARDITARRHAERATRFLADASAALAELADQEITLARIARLAVPDFADWCAVDVLTDEGELRRLAIEHHDPARLERAGELLRKYPPRTTDARGARHVMRTGQAEWEAAISDEVLATIAQDAEHLRLLRELGLRSYMCVPLKSRGAILGAFTFVMSESGRDYDADDLRLARDLADRVGLAMENKRLLEALRDTDRRKDQFLATLAHELRNPLAPVSNALQVMRLSGELGPTSADLRDLMERQIGHLTRLVDDLMDVSRITRGKFELRKQPVELSSIIESAVEISGPLIDEAGHSLILNLRHGPAVLDADAVRLAQVITNLLTNAARYMARGGRIELATAIEGGQAAITVRDQGYGIPPEMLSHIFEMFTQIEQTRQRVHGGLGIGLALAKSLVEMHGGTIEARSPGLGQGSEFLVRIPVCHQSAGMPVARLAEMAAAPSRKVLVVDDTRAALVVLEKLLRAMGQEVRAVPTAEEALTWALEDPPDIVISDIGMPGVDGYELARRIRREPTLRRVVLVALTGYGQAGDRQRALSAGFDQHLVKPVGVDDLRVVLASSPAGRSD